MSTLRPAASVEPASLPEPPPPTGFRRIAAALTYRDFRVLWFGAFTSTIGTWMQKVAQNWLVLTITGTSSAFFLGLDSFLGELPILLLTLVGGVVADRYDRRHLLLTSQYIQMSTAAALALLVYFDLVRIWHILALSFVTGLAQAFGGPAYQSLIPSLVDKKDLPNAVALNSIQFNVARMLGPLLAGATLAAFKRAGVEDMTDFAVCFGLNALSFLVVIVSLMSLHIKHLPGPRAHKMMTELRQGLTYVRQERSIMALMVLGAGGGAAAACSSALSCASARAFCAPDCSISARAASSFSSVSDSFRSSSLARRAAWASLPRSRAASAHSSATSSSSAP